MKKMIGPLLLAALLTGCRAHMMETYGDSIRLFSAGKEKPGK